MFKKIYTSIDNSDVSDKVLHDTMILAKENNALLRVVHVLNLEQVTFGMGIVGVTDELQKTLHDNATKLLDRAKEVAKQHNIDKIETALLKSYNDNIAAVIIDDAHQWNADLFVLGSHGLGALTHIIAGGVVEKITKNSEVPILLITKHK